MGKKSKENRQRIKAIAKSISEKEKDSGLNSVCSHMILDYNTRSDEHHTDSL